MKKIYFVYCFLAFFFFLEFNLEISFEIDVIIAGSIPMIPGSSSSDSDSDDMSIVWLAPVPGSANFFLLSRKSIAASTFPLFCRNASIASRLEIPIFNANIASTTPPASELEQAAVEFEPPASELEPPAVEFEPPASEFLPAIAEIIHYRS
jgi:hypothetical protein